jgi:hypothetical protein
MNHSGAIKQTISDYQSCLDSLEADLKSVLAKSTEPRIQNGLRELLELLGRKRASIEPNALLELEGLEARIDSGLRRFAELQARQEIITQRLVALANSAGTGNP